MAEPNFGRYEVEDEIGQGAMGKVYRAYDPLTNRRVAIKALKDEIVSQDETGEYQKRFQREARAAGSLSHPNIITIFDVGENYFVMELLEGKSLLTLLADREPMSLEETLSIVAPIADALAYAHSKGVYHRDVKPANIMVFPDGRPVITDFGLAHLESTVMTAAGQFLGSPSYMSPEQVVGEEITPKADLFSLSVVTYEMLTGEKPFPGDNVTSVIYRVVHSPPVSPTEHNPSLPSDYEHIFRRALAKDPGKRFADFSQFIAALNLEGFVPLREVPGETTLVSTGGAPVDLEPPGEQDTIDLPVPGGTADSGASITERERPPETEAERKPWLLIGGAVAALVLLALILLPAFWSDPILENLLVETNPDGAEVYIDGTLAGVSPFALPTIAFGDHDLRIEKEGFVPLEERLSLVHGEVSETLSFALQPAHITLYLESTPEGAEVTIDGEPVGTTPLEDVELEPGQHEVQIDRRGYETWRSVVAAQAGESINLVAPLRAVPRASAPRTTATASETAETASAKSAPASEAQPQFDPTLVPLPTAPPPPERGELIELGANDTPPKKIAGRTPAYPPLARKLNQQGRGMLQFVVTEEGIPTEIEVLESAGAILDQAVLDAVAEWRYTPAERQGVQVKARLRIRQTFRLGR